MFPMCSYIKSQCYSGVCCHVSVIPRQKDCLRQEVCHRLDVSLCYAVTSRHPLLQSGTLSEKNQSVLGNAAKVWRAYLT